ncbi:MAG: radical SAM protein [Bacteroidales bacterium]
MKILLISPGSTDDIDSQITQGIPYLFAKTLFAPHAIAAVAALTPPEHEVDLHDEFVNGAVENRLTESGSSSESYDIIGISVTSNQQKRSLVVARHAKKVSPSSLVILGGIGVEHFIHQEMTGIDVIFHGEAEETWPTFLEDFKKGTHQRIYRNITKPDMVKTPAPRWELLASDLSSYTAVLLQTTRGCPFDCSFCDVIYTFGRKLRSKSIEQVLEEVRRLSALKVKMVFIADDNFAGDKKYTKELLKQLIPLNNSFKTPIEFITQIDITIANDEELLTLLADCNFQAVMIGIESVNEASLKDYNKQQNLRFPIREAVQKIQSYGIVVLAHMIIGADSDDETVFEKTAAFIADANIVHHLCHPLAAPPGTKMWYELKRAGRIIHTDNPEIADKLDIVSNIIPKQMTRVALYEGLADYWKNIYDPEKFTRRAITFINQVKYKPNIKEPGLSVLWTLRKMLWRVFTFFMFDAGKAHKKAFFTILRATQKKGMYLLPKIIYIYTCYLVDYNRSMYDARIAREHAAWERENGHKLIIDDNPIPVSEKIREHSAAIFNEAYRHVRHKVAHKEVLYNTVVQAMMDYNDRFGKSFEAFDVVQEEHVRNTCDRIIAALPPNGQTLPDDLPLLPPPGFTREILDALDNAVRYQRSRN